MPCGSFVEKVSRSPTHADTAIKFQRNKPDCQSIEGVKVVADFGVGIRIASKHFAVCVVLKGEPVHTEHELELLYVMPVRSCAALNGDRVPESAVKAKVT